RDLREERVGSLTLAWHRLDAWPDVNAGFARLASNFLLAPVSNANISLMADLARRNQLRFDAILGSEIAGDYKPKPRVYLAAAEAFDLPPGECMMVSAAAHTGDIIGAKTVRLRVASIGSPREVGPGTAVSVPKESVDVVAQNLIDLADKLSAARGYAGFASRAWRVAIRPGVPIAHGLTRRPPNGATARRPN